MTSQIIVKSVNFIDQSSIYVKAASGLIYGVNLDTKQLSLLEESFERFCSSSRFISFSQFSAAAAGTKSVKTQKKKEVSHKRANSRESAGTKVARKNSLLGTPSGRHHRRQNTVISMITDNKLSQRMTSCEAKSPTSAFRKAYSTVSIGNQSAQSRRSNRSN